MPKVIALKDFISPVHGNISVADVFNIKDDVIAQNMAAANLVKVIDVPKSRKDQTPEPEAKEPSVENIKEQLRELGVSFHPRTGKTKLLELLKEAENGDASETAST